jgi:hypothetical protein
LVYKNLSGNVKGDNQAHTLALDSNVQLIVLQKLQDNESFVRATALKVIQVIKNF